MWSLQGDVVRQVTLSSLMWSLQGDVVRRVPLLEAVWVPEALVSLDDHVRDERHTRR
jgi:hypothetical protein